MSVTTQTGQLADLSSEYPLAQDRIDAFQRDGHVLLKGVASPDEVRGYRNVITELTDAFAKAHYGPLEDRDTYGKAFIQHMNLWTKDARVAKFTLARRFGKIAADLLGVEGVRLYHDQALYKEPHGGFTPLHQDQQYWPLDGVKCVTMWMPLVDLEAEMGTLNFASGSQQLGYLGEMGISDQSEGNWRKLIEERGYPLTKEVPMSAGDATFHNGWVLHGAPGNASDTRVREAMTVIFLEDGAKISKPDNPYRENDLKTWFPGLKPGDVAASKINPLIYKR